MTTLLNEFMCESYLNGGIPLIPKLFIPFNGIGTGYYKQPAGSFKSRPIDRLQRAAERSSPKRCSSVDQM